MKIYPKDKNLLEHICEIVKSNSIWPYGQYKCGNYLINMNRFPEECLCFNKTGDIIDGYVITDTTYTYNGKTFSEILNETN
jgi:hypothetical protein